MTFFSNCQFVRCVHKTFFIVVEFTSRNQPTDRCKRISLHLDHEYHDRPITSDSPCISKSSLFRILLRFLSVYLLVQGTVKKYSRKESTGIAQHIFKSLHTNGVYTAFPNTEVLFRIRLSLMSTNCFGEQSFSQLARIKNVNRSTMSQDHLGVLALLRIEKELLHETDFSSIIDKIRYDKIKKS